MGLLVRPVLLAAALVAELLVARDAPNFGVVQGLVGLALIATGVGVIASLRRS